MEGKDIYICRKGWRHEREINLMLISEGDKWHYTVIKSLSRLLSSSNSKHKRKQYFCNNCLQGFTQELSRDQHYSYCIDNETVRVEMPRKGSTIEFYDGQNQFKVPFMMYADFESILNPIKERGPKSLGTHFVEGPTSGVAGTCTPPGGGDPNEPYAECMGPSGACTSEVFWHIPSGWCVYSKFAYGEVKDPLTIYRGKDCVEKFCEYIRQEARRLYHMFPEKPMDPLTNGQ